jgi:hypothetical protein
VIARLSRRVVVRVEIMMVVVVMMVMSRVAVVRLVMVMIAKAVGVTSLGSSDQGIILPAAPNAAKLPP